MLTWMEYSVMTRSRSDHPRGQGLVTPTEEQRATLRTFILAQKNMNRAAAALKSSPTFCEKLLAGFPVQAKALAAVMGRVAS